MNRRLYRSTKDRMLAGVCGGLAEYTNTDPNIIRIVALLVLMTGVGVIAYLAAWVIIPECGYQSYEAGMNTENSSPEAHSINDSRTFRILGWALLVLGGYSLIDQTCLPYNIRPYFWPVIMVVAGVYILYKHRSSQA